MKEFPRYMPDSIDPKGPLTGEKRVLKGGYYYTKASGASILHLSQRMGAALNVSNGQKTQYGYRVCCPAP